MKNFFLKIWNGIKKAYEWCAQAVGKAASWFRHDGFDHMVLSALLVLAMGWIRPLWIPAIVALVIGAGKEIYDKVSGKGTAEWHDIICDLIGIALGYLIILINFLGQR